MEHAAGLKSRMNPAIAMRVQCIVVIAAAMITAELVARTLGAGFFRSVVSAGSVLLAGYMGGVVFLLRRRAHIGRFLRTRLAISLLAPPAIGVMALAQPMSSTSFGLMLIFGTLAALPMLWLGCHDVARGLRGQPPGAWRLDEDFNPALIVSIGWSLIMAFLVLVVLAPFLHLGPTALAIAGILAANAGAEIAMLGWGVVVFAKEALEEMGNTLVNGPTGGPSSSGDDEWLWEDSRRISDDDSPSIYPEVRIYNPSTGLEMLGAFDAGGYGLGESPSDKSSWDHSSIDSFSSHDGGITGSSCHDS